MKADQNGRAKKSGDSDGVERRSRRETTRSRRGRARLRSLEDLDGRTTAARRARQLVAGLESDLGGDLTTGQRQLAQRIALAGALAEDLETRWLEGEPIDLADYVRVTNAQRRLLTTIGIHRVPRDVTGAVLEHLRGSA